MNNSRRPEDSLTMALDTALARNLAGPELPHGFRTRLLEAQARAPKIDHATRLRELESEHDERLAILRANFILLRRRTLGTVIGIAFTGGAAIAAAVPWITATFGSSAAFLVAPVGTAVGVAIAMAGWLRRAELADWLL